MATAFVNRPQKQMRIIALSPIAQVFQPYTDLEQYLENPEKVRRMPAKGEPPIKIMIEGAHATEVYELGRVYVVDEDKAMKLVGVGNDRFSREYGGSGFVYFDAPKEVLAALQYQLDTGAELDKNVKKKMEESLAKLRDLSEKRILDHCKLTYMSLIEGRNREKEAGKTPQDPGAMEMIISFILAEYIKEKKAKRARLHAQFKNLEQEITSEAI